MKTKFCAGLVVVVLVLVGAAPAVAQSDWQYSIAPYLWAAGMDGTVTVAESELDVDVPFSTIIENLDMALMGHFDMRNDRWMIASDLIFVDLETEEDLTHGAAVAGMDMTILELAGGYRVSPAVSVVAGVRWVDMGTSLSYFGEVETLEGDMSKDWIDPLVGLHVWTPLSDKWWLGARADIGGFGVGSELSWQAYADIGLKVSRVTSLILGYHVLDIDYEDGELPHYLGLDLMVSGPQLGVVFTF